MHIRYRKCMSVWVEERCPVLMPCICHVGARLRRFVLVTGGYSKNRVDTRFRFQLTRTVYIQSQEYANDCENEGFHRHHSYGGSNQDASYIHVFVCPASQYIGWTYRPTKYSEGDAKSMITISPVTMPYGTLEHRNLGYTLVHEMGHFFNLRHTFEGNTCSGAGDGCADTPPQSEPHHTYNVGTDTCTRGDQLPDAI